MTGWKPPKLESETKECHGGFEQDVDSRIHIINHGDMAGRTWGFHGHIWAFKLAMKDHIPPDVLAVLYTALKIH